jgi:RNA polymerase sigma-70 factor (ECF subfamily)
MSDNELVDIFQSDGNPAIVGELFRRYRHLVFGVCMKYLTDEDESQDVLMQVFEKLLRDLGRHEVKQFKGWLYTVTKNECLIYLRNRKSKWQHEENMQKELMQDMETEYFLHPPDQMDVEARLRQLENNLSNLNAHQRQCIELFYLQQKTYQQVAELTGYSLNEVKSHIQNGKRNLKIAIDDPQHG